MKTYRYISMLATVIVALSCSKTESMEHDVAQVLPESVVPGELIVKMDPAYVAEHGLPGRSSFEGYVAEPLFAENPRFEKRHREAGLHLWYILKFDRERPLTKASASVASLPGVELVEYSRNVSFAAAASFNDPGASQQWSLDRIRVKDAWKIETGKPEVIVAVMDEGVDYDHEDLALNMWTDEDGKHGYNFVVNEKEGLVGDIEPGDHGTHVAGIIAAVNGNGKGLSGIAGGNGQPGTGVRILSAQTGPGSAAIGEAFVYSADSGACLVNCSWSIPDVAETPKFIRTAIEYFNKYAGFDENGVQVGPMAGGLAIFAAGNESSTESYPAKDDDVLAVAASSISNKFALYSNYGSWVDITAPGGDSEGGILSTLPGSDYGIMQGTSMAAPQVTGVAALVLSRLGGKGFTREMLFQALVKTSNPDIYKSDPMREGNYGYGIVDAYAAVTCTGFYAPEKVTGLSATARPGWLRLSWPVPAGHSGDVPFRYNIKITEIATGEMLGAVIRNGEVGAGEDFICDVYGVKSDTDYYITVQSENIFGEVAEESEPCLVRSSANSAPVITPLSGTEISLKAHQNTTLSFEIVDPEGNAFTASVEGFGKAASITYDGKHFIVKINALLLEDGKSHEGFIVANDGELENRLGLTVNVAANHAPVVLKPIENIVVSSLQSKRMIDLADVFADEDAETMRFVSRTGSTIINEDTMHIRFVISDPEIAELSLVSGQIQIAPKAYGTTDVTVFCSDDREEAVSCDFKILVRNGEKPYDCYPNPVKDFLFVRSGNPVTRNVSVIDSKGATVLSIDAAQIDPFSPLKVDMSACPSGIYTINTEDLSETIVKI